MILNNERLRKTSEKIFQEANPPDGRGRPLEWRRNFNFVYLPLKDVKIINGITVHDRDYSWDDEKGEEPLRLLKPSLSDNISIVGVLDENKVRDSIYYAVEGDEEGLYSVEGVKGQTKITLRSGPPTNESKDVPAGLFWGMAFRLNYEPGQDELCFDLTVPKEQIQSLTSILKEQSNALVEVGAYLLSFTYEVDDALREPYHPQDFIINDSTKCFVSWVNVTSGAGINDRSPDVEEVESDESSQYVDQDSKESEIEKEQQTHHELLSVLLSYLKPLNSLVLAVWVLIAVITASLFIR